MKNTQKDIFTLTPRDFKGTVFWMLLAKGCFFSFSGSLVCPLFLFPGRQRGRLPSSFIRKPYLFKNYFPHILLFLLCHLFLGSALFLSVLLSFWHLVHTHTRLECWRNPWESSSARPTLLTCRPQVFPYHGNLLLRVPFACCSQGCTYMWA